MVRPLSLRRWRGGAGAPASRASDSGGGAWPGLPCLALSLALGLLVARALPAHATPVSWKNPSSGAWSVGDNWDAGVTPGPADTAMIAVDGTYTVTLDVNSAIARLELGGTSGRQTLSATRRTLSTTGGLRVAGTGRLELHGQNTLAGDLESEGTVVVQGTGSSLAGSFTQLLAGHLQLLEGGLTVANGLTNAGTIEGYGTLTLGGGTLINKPGGVIAPQSLALTLAAPLANHGTVLVPPSTTLTLEGPSNAHLNAATGTIQTPGALEVVGGSLVNDGTIDVAGTFTVTSSASFDAGAGTLKGAGKLELISAALLGGDLSPTLDISLTNALVSATSLTVSPGRTLRAYGATGLYCPVTNAGTMWFQWQNWLPDTLITLPGSRIELHQATLSISRSFVNHGSIVCDPSGGGTTLSADTIFNAPDGTFDVQAQPCTVQAWIVNEGVVTVGSAGALTLGFRFAARPGSVVQLDGGSLTFSPQGFTYEGGLTGHGNVTDASGTITFAPSAFIAVQGGSLVLSAAVANQGAASVAGGSTLLLDNPHAGHSNSGTITIAPVGTFRIYSGSFDNLGTIQLDGTFTMQGGQTLTLAGGVLAGTGLLRLVEAATLGGAATTLAVNGLVGVGGRIACASFSLAAGKTLTLNGSATVLSPFDNAGTLEVTGAPNTIAGTLTSRPGSKILLAGGTLTLSSDFANADSIVATNPASLSSLTLTSDTLTNLSGGVIAALNGPLAVNAATVSNQGHIAAPRPLTLDAAVVNSGSMVVGDRTALSKGSATHLNQGSIAVTSAGTLRVTAGGFENRGTLDLTGTFDLAGGGTFLWDDGTVQGMGTMSFDGANLQGATVVADVNVSFGAGAIQGGSFAVAAGRTLHLMGSARVQSALDLAGTLSVEGPSNTLDGALTHHPGSRFVLTSGALTVANGFASVDSILTGGSPAGTSYLTIAAGTFTNLPGGVVASPGGALVLAAPTVLNQGRIVARTSLTVISEVDNQGELVADGALYLAKPTATHTNSGSITIGSQRTLTVQGGALDLAMGTLGGQGTLALSGATLLGGDLELPVDLSLTDAVVDVSRLTVPGTHALRAFGGSVVNCAVANAGTVFCRGRNRLQGALETQPGSRIELSGGSLTVASGFSNHGTIASAYPDPGVTDTLRVAAGTLTNGSGGVIQPESNDLLLDAELVNEGMLAVPTSRTLAIGGPSVTQVNRGTATISPQGTLHVSSGTFRNEGLLLADGTLRITSGATLDATAGGTSTGSGTLLLEHAILKGGDLTLELNTTLVADSLDCTSILNPPGRMLKVEGPMVVTCPLRNAGTLLARPGWRLGDSSTVTLTGDLITQEGSSLVIEPNAILAVPSGFTNVGAIHAGGGEGPGTLAVASGVLVNAAQGVIAPEAGPLTLAATLDNRGTISVVGRTLTLDKPGALHSNSGWIVLGTSKSYLAVMNGGVLDVDGGSITGSGRLSFVDASLAGAHVATTVDMSFLRSAMACSSLTVTPGHTVTLYSNPPILADLHVAGHLVVAGDDTLTGSLTSEPSGLIELGDTLTVAFGFVNRGTIQPWRPRGALLIPDGTLINAPDGTITTYAWSFSLNCALENQGTVEVMPAVTLTVRAPVGSHVNSGLVHIRVLATLVVAAGAFLNDAAGTITGNGTLDVSAVPFFTQGAIEPSTFPTPTVGALTVLGHATFGPSSALRIQLGATADTSAYDRLLVSGDVALDGGLEIARVGEVVPPLGARYTVVQGGTVSGGFSSVVGGHLGYGRAVRVDYLPDRVELTVVDSTTATLLALFEAAAAENGIELRWQLGDPGTFPAVTVERSDAAAGPWAKVEVERRLEGEAQVALDRAVEPGRTYFYRLVASTADGRWLTLGQLSATAGVPVREFTLSPPAPNPAAGWTRVSFSVARTGRVQLSVLDAMGRTVARLADADRRVGRYQALWNGEGEHGRVPAGIYFVHLRAPGVSLVRRVVVVR